MKETWERSKPGTSVTIPGNDRGLLQSPTVLMWPNPSISGHIAAVETHQVEAHSIKKTLGSLSGGG